MMVSFPDHVSLLTAWLDRRSQIAHDIETRLLNIHGKPAAQTSDRAGLDQLFASCFFGATGLPRSLSRLNGQLAQAHVGDGFEPVRLEHRSDRLDAVDLVLRAHHFWERHRWPGRQGRLAFAGTLFSVFLLQQLEYLSLRIWDDGNRAGDCLRDLQSLLDRLNATSGSNAFIRDARWLIQTAQGPLTRHLQPYFTIAAHISSSLPDVDRLEVHKASVTLAGGHLRSQLRYRTAETGRAPDDPEVLATTRNSNSMDGALLIGDLVPLLEAYADACARQEHDRRLDLADVVLQGVSADPELFVGRRDALGPATMIEEVFIDRRDGVTRYTPAGDAHRTRLARYDELIDSLAEALSADALEIAERRDIYSPFGIAYGFCADILSNMAMEALRSHPSFGLSLEDMFVTGGALESKWARARGWEALAAMDGRREHFEHSLDWAAQVLDRTRHALRVRETPLSRQPAGRLFVVPQSRNERPLTRGGFPEGVPSAQEHCVTSDFQRALASGATAFPKSQFLLDRKEGRFLASVETEGKWFGVSKVLLTTFICHGKDALIADVPEAVIDILRLTCPELVVVVSG